MSTITFDIHQTLQARGFKVEQAEGISEAFRTQ
jgi:hypothetical protein